MTAAPTARSSASTTMCRCRRRISRASGCGGSWRSAPCSPPARSSGRSCSATTTGPASCWPAPCAAYVNRFGVAPGRRAVVFADNDDGWRTAADLADAGVEVAALVDAGAAARRPRASGRACAARAICDGAAIQRVRGRPGRQGVDDQRCERQDRAHRLRSASPCPAAGTRPSISPPISAASRCGTRRSGLRARHAAAGHERRRRGRRRRSTLGRVPGRRRAAAGAAAAADCGFTAPAGAGSRRRRTKSAPATPALAGRRRAAARPSSISRTT